MASSISIWPLIQQIGVQAVAAKLTAKSAIGADGECHEWQGKRDQSGYGYIHLGGTFVRAHRVAMALRHGGELPKGKFVCHTCDNPPCVNPAHLWLGSPADNTSDMVAKGRKADFRGVLNPRAKLTPDKVRSIRTDPRGSKVVSRAFGVSRITVRQIRSREIWGSVA